MSENKVKNNLFKNFKFLNVIYVKLISINILISYFYIIFLCFFFKWVGNLFR